MTATKTDAMFKVVLVGATGLVGKELIAILHERQFLVDQLVVVSHDSEIGKEVYFGDQTLELKRLTPSVFNGAHVVFFACGADVVEKSIHHALESGAWVIDLSEYSRINQSMTPVLVGVNEESVLKRLTDLPESEKKLHKDRWLANANCVASHLCVALSPIAKKYGIKRIITSTYQSVAGAGIRGMEEFSKQVKDLFNYRETTSHFFKHRVAFNLLAQIGEADDQGLSAEENDIIKNVKSIFAQDDLEVMATAVRVPVFHGHAQSVAVELSKDVSVEDVQKLLDQTPGIILLDEPKEHIYPIPSEVQGQDEVFVGRIRQDPHHANIIHLWIVADNLRKGSALNAVQLAEKLVTRA